MEERLRLVRVMREMVLPETGVLLRSGSISSGSSPGMETCLLRT